MAWISAFRSKKQYVSISFRSNFIVRDVLTSAITRESQTRHHWQWAHIKALSSPFKTVHGLSDIYCGLYLFVINTAIFYRTYASPLSLKLFDCPFNQDDKCYASHCLFFVTTVHILKGAYRLIHFSIKILFWFPCTLVSTAFNSKALGCPFHQDYEAYDWNCKLKVSTVEFLKRALTYLKSVAAIFCFDLNTVLFHCARTFPERLKSLRLSPYMMKNSVADPDPGSGALLLLGSGSGSGINFPRIRDELLIWLWRLVPKTKRSKKKGILCKICIRIRDKTSRIC
jgi:hypothetical protein